MKNLIRIKLRQILCCLLIVSNGYFIASVYSETDLYKTPRMADGKPILQGVWTNASITTLERSSKYKDLIIPKDSVAALTRSHPQVVRQNTDDNLDQDDGLLDGTDLARGRGYNAFWIDPGREFGLVKGTRRTSWIVDPPNGHIPYNKHGQEWINQLRNKRKSFDGPEVRPPAERCLIIGGRVGPPMVNGLYNNNYQIVQTSDHLAIWVEMVSHVRIIPIYSKKQLTKTDSGSVNTLFGNSIAYWDGDTLEMVTTGFHPLQAESPVPLSPTGKVTERFTRVSAQQIFYEFSVDDPKYYTTIWRGEMSLNKQDGQVYEYACHEGNYALDGILAGARLAEKHQ